MADYLNPEQKYRSPNNVPSYRSSAKRAPSLPPIQFAPTLSETSGPQFGASRLAGRRADLTRVAAGGEALGQRIVVFGRVCDQHGRAESEALIELWQANAAGRYRHDGDQHDAPLDPNFSGAGATVTDSQGNYQFTTIEPGAYPWANHYNAWRPKHLHFSLFGRAWTSRLVTQMYFPGDPTLALDPIFNGVSDEAARQRLVARFDPDHSVPDVALAYRFDIVLRGTAETPMERS